MQALEGLPGVDGLEAYEFVSRRTGGWEAETRRLQKEGDKRSRLASRVGRVKLNSVVLLRLSRPLPASAFPVVGCLVRVESPMDVFVRS